MKKAPEFDKKVRMLQPWQHEALKLKLLRIAVATTGSGKHRLLAAQKEKP